MTKTLIKKQMLEVFSWLYQNKKTGKHVHSCLLYSWTISDKGCSLVDGYTVS